MRVNDSELIDNTHTNTSNPNDISNGSSQDEIKEELLLGNKFADAVKDANEPDNGGRFKSTAVKLPDGPPKGMPAVGHTTDFPRTDNLYRKKESLPYDECQSLVWKERPVESFKESSKELVVYLVLGLMVGTTAFIMKTAESYLILLFYETAQDSITKGYEAVDEHKIWEGYIFPWLIYSLGATSLGLISSAMTTYWGQGAAGSGVAELVGYMNGVNYPDFISMPTFVTKVIGVTLAVAGKLCVGKEGPLAHIGGIIGAFTLYLPGMDHFRNDDKKRAFIAAGASAGVAVAFGAPIGGALFSYELSKPNTFWKFMMLWKVFLTTSIATFTLASWGSIKSGNYSHWSGASIKFGIISGDQAVDVQSLLPASIILGLIGGALGAGFICINFRVNGRRKNICKSKCSKVVETMAFCFITASLFFWMPAVFQGDHLESCLSKSAPHLIAADTHCESSPLKNSSLALKTKENCNNLCLNYAPVGKCQYFTYKEYSGKNDTNCFLYGHNQDQTPACSMTYQAATNLYKAGGGDLTLNDAESFHRGWCPPDQYSPLATIFWSSEGEIIQNIMSSSVIIEAKYMFVFFFAWYFMMAITYGVNVPAGLFLPGMIIGCAVGHIYGYQLNQWGIITEANYEMNKKNYIIIAIAGYMAGYTRLTYSLCVILMETSQQINICMPLLITIFISCNFAALFTRGLYDRGVRGKQMPILVEEVPIPCQKIIAEKIMARDPITCRNIETVENIKTALLSSHHGFPVMNSKGNVVGLIPKNFLIVLIKNKAWYIWDKDSAYQESQTQKGNMDKFQRQVTLQQVKNQSLMQSNKESANQILTLKNEDQYAMRRKDTMVAYTGFFDSQYPPTPAENLVPWQEFQRDFESKDLLVDAYTKLICEQHLEERIDLRPYIIEHPYSAQTTDSLEKCLDLFRKMHLRHLIVTHPANGELRGIITRQDLFAFLDL